MRLMIDPRNGDVDDDASSTKRRSLFSLAGTLLAEISLPKLAVAWILLIGLPSLLIGLAPLLASIWVTGISSKAYTLLTGVSPALLLLLLGILGWFGGRPLLRLAESSFWSLNALAVQPGYILCREGFRHLAERFLSSSATEDQRAFTRAVSAAVSGAAICGFAVGLFIWAWPSSRWIGNVSDLASPLLLFIPALFNTIVLTSGYLAVAALVWGIADATMPQPRQYNAFCEAPVEERAWRVAHLSDIHVVGERYGFRIESGRSGPRGNERFQRTLEQLNRIHTQDPLDAVLITGDLTDAGRSAEWAEFFDALAPYQELSKLLLILPGNHDLNVVDRANPARLDLPTSPKKRLRQIRTISALEALQGSKVRMVDNQNRRLGTSLSEALKPHLNKIATFADHGSFRLSRSLANLWATSFPMIQPPETDDGLGFILLNSNIEAHFSFTNALGLVSTEQAQALNIVIELYPKAYWIVALHHHVVEYPKRAKALSERIGTALINGSWFVRHLERFAGRAIVMHGHRHIDWIGACGRIPIVSAPSPVMESTDESSTYFYIHTLSVTAEGFLGLAKPERIDVPGRLAISP
jgi:3',5'-cyclic AMP phosphodiesterase CpdA